MMVSIALYFWHFEEKIHDDILLLDPASKQHEVAHDMGAEYSQAAELEEVASLPHHVQAHDCDVVEEDVPLHAGVREPVPLHKVSQPEIKFKWKVQDGETGVGDETFKHTFLFPRMVICQDARNIKLEFVFLSPTINFMSDLKTYAQAMKTQM